MCSLSWTFEPVELVDSFDDYHGYLGYCGLRVYGDEVNNEMYIEDEDVFCEKENGGRKACQ